MEEVNIETVQADRDKNRSWEEKIFSRKEAYQGTIIKVWGM
jgi:hypothetical protein